MMQLLLSLRVLNSREMDGTISQVRDAASGASGACEPVGSVSIVTLDDIILADVLPSRYMSVSRKHAEQELASLSPASYALAHALARCPRLAYDYASLGFSVVTLKRPELATLATDRALLVVADRVHRILGPERHMLLAKSSFTQKTLDSFKDPPFVVDMPLHALFIGGSSSHPSNCIRHGVSDYATDEEMEAVWRHLPFDQVNEVTTIEETK
jgi:hypothetical protein